MESGIATFLLALPVAAFAFYIALKKVNLCAAIVLLGAPILVNGADVFIPGNLTMFREFAFALWSFLALYVLLHGIEKK